MKIEETPIAGLKKIKFKKIKDLRGEFVKTYSSDLGIHSFRESFYSISKKNVLRGMHFQTPPDETAKLVSVTLGRALDVVIDLRRTSATYLKIYDIELSGENNFGLFIPEGLAHGFLSLEDHTVMNYLQTRPFSPTTDSGIFWDSFGYRWPTEQPIISDKDSELVHLKYFNNCFI